MRLRSARLTNNTLVSQVDDLIGSLETDLADILGFTLNTNITASAFSIDNSGRITKALIQQVPTSEQFGGVGDTYSLLQITNSTNNDKNYIGYGRTPLAVAMGGGDANMFFLGSGAAMYEGGGLVDRGSPLDLRYGWAAFSFIMDDVDASGYWAPFGIRPNSSSQSVIPATGGGANVFMGSDGVFRGVGTFQEQTILYSPRSPGDGESDWLANTPQDPEWQSEAYDNLETHAANATTIVVPSTGTYFIEGEINILSSGLVGTAQLRILRKRAGVDTEWARTTRDTVTGFGTPETSLQVEAVVSLNASDTIRLEVTLTSGATTYTVTQGDYRNHLALTRVL